MNRKVRAADLTQPIAGHAVLMRALKNKDPQALARWLAFEPDVNDPRIARPRYKWDFEGQQEMAIDAGQALKSAWPLLHQAIGDGSEPHLQMTKMLLDAGADPAQHVHALGGRIAEQAAMVPKNSLQMLQIMLDAGVDMITPSPTGASPILVAARLGNIEMMERLADLGADITAKNDKEVGLLATGLDHPEVCEWVLKLLPEEANAFHINSFGKRVTCLMEACDKGYTGSVHVLMGHGADPKLKSSEGYDAYDYAEMMARNDLAQWMRAFEAASQARSVMSSIRHKSAPRSA